MTAYCWDFGFNWNALQSSCFSGAYPLENGFIYFASGTADPEAGILVNLASGDTVSFYLYNMTSGVTAATMGNFSIVSASVGLSPGVSGNPSSPFSVNAVLGAISAPGNAVWTEWYSTAFEAQLPAWTGFPQQLIQNDGTFQLVASVTVQSGTSSQSQMTFMMDPEMIIGGTG